MEPKIITLSAKKLAGYILNTTGKAGENFRTIPKFWADYMTDGRMEKLHGEGFLTSHTEYGACFPENPATGEFEYLIGVEAAAPPLTSPVDGLATASQVPPAYEVRDIPAATYAVFSSPPADSAGFIDAIQGVWRYIFADWLPKSTWQIDPKGVNFELYDERAMAEAGKVCDIYVPVVKG
ncbi:hypothetical protein AGMMS49991_03190 [Spirochaetia bacterium]|nr:hypothetical protein AGMMS49991_03190 [Spirochaetia bacterium]